MLIANKEEGNYEKNTSEIVKELGLCPDFKTFYDKNKDYMMTEKLTELLAQLLESKGLQKAQVIKKAELSEVYGYQIFSGIRVPERKNCCAWLWEWV